jgi:SWI/SNF-related matrix-associated actin-dependent regulator of chromatin subfamily A member 5
LIVEWVNLTKRARTERTVIIDGFAISKESLSCGEWEAFPTFSANFKQPPKRKRATHENQDYCLLCRDGGEVVVCNGCPRVFHAKCAGYADHEIKSMMQFYCPQHNCSKCYRTTVACGGMLFRCQTCPDSFWYVPLNTQFVTIVRTVFLRGR